MQMLTLMAENDTDTILNSHTILLLTLVFRFNRSINDINLNKSPILSPHCNVFTNNAESVGVLQWVL
jgi:hypothetical protein